MLDAGPRLGGTEGNARLTASTAVVLVALLAVEGVTILFLRPLFSLHVFVGMLLVPVIGLKLASTGWRFARYYLQSRAYREAGPPQTFLRLLAPVVVLSTIGVFGTGIALAVDGPPGGFVLGLHKASFIVWLGSTSIHVLAHVRRAARNAAADLRPRRAAPGLHWRVAALGVSLAAGLVLAFATLHLAGAWTSHFGFGDG